MNAIKKELIEPNEETNNNCLTNNNYRKKNKLKIFKMKTLIIKLKNHSYKVGKYSTLKNNIWNWFSLLQIWFFYC